MATGIRNDSVQPHLSGSCDLSTACDRTLQISIAVATLATASFITLSALSYFTVASALVASFSGLTDAVLIAALSCKKCVLEDQPLKIQNPSSLGCDSPNGSLNPSLNVPIIRPDLLPASTSQGSAPKPPTPRPNPLSQEEWAQRLRAFSSSDRPGQYNLLDPAQPLAPPTTSGYLALPTFGNYNNSYEHICNLPAFGVRLPPSQLLAFPQGIQDLFGRNPQVELYFLIYNDSQDKTIPRNLVMHHMAMPEYDPRKNLNGLICRIEAGIFAPQGLEKCEARADALVCNQLKPFAPHLHPTNGAPFAISPNTCTLRVQSIAPLCSFYTAARFRGRDVAFFTLLIRNPESPEGLKVQEALQHAQLCHAVESLSEESSPRAEEVRKLFAYYS